MMTIYRADQTHLEQIIPLIAKFRVALKQYRGIQSSENLAGAKQEFLEYLEAGYPIFFCVSNDVCAGYLVCRVDAPTVWVESLYVVETMRRMGIASALYGEAENLAAALGDDTPYNYVHPNNDAMLRFLDNRGYSVLNLIEIRRKYPTEVIREKIRIRNNVFDY